MARQGKRESAIDGANFASRTIWTGDNLTVMRGMNGGCVDLIYLDPPFNSNRDYAAPVGSQAAGAAFKDTWTLDDIDHHEHGELAESHPAAYDVIKAARTCHGRGMMSYLIYMAVRLIEMKRVLAPTGSIWLHCDDTAGAYLKMLMDAVFGSAAFRSQVAWRRSAAKGNATKAFGRTTDTLLHYALEGATFHQQFKPLSESTLKQYRYDDGDGRGLYRLVPLANSLRRENLMFDWQGWESPPNGWRVSRERMQALHDDNRIAYPARKSMKLNYKKFLRDAEGVGVGTSWTDIPQASGAERLGYPTQKPVALLERIINASSNPHDLVFDPFCGCATTCVAAEAANRKWVGCDISPRAVEIVMERLGWTSGVNNPKAALKRTDEGDLPPPRTHRQFLYGVQGGYCKGCGEHYPPKLMEVDHIEPQSKGGSDHIDNLQLLCCHCNRSKGGRNMAEWKASKETN